MNKKHFFLCLILSFQIVTPETTEQQKRNKVVQLIKHCAPRPGEFRDNFSSQWRTKKALPQIKAALIQGKIDTGVITRIDGKKQSLIHIAQDNPLILPLIAKYYPAYQRHLQQRRHMQELQKIFQKGGISYVFYSI